MKNFKPNKIMQGNPVPSNYQVTLNNWRKYPYNSWSFVNVRNLIPTASILVNSDNKITNGELIAYLKQNVSEEAFINNRQQEPMLSGDPNSVLINY